MFIPAFMSCLNLFVIKERINTMLNAYSSLVKAVKTSKILLNCSVS